MPAPWSRSPIAHATVVIAANDDGPRRMLLMQLSVWYPESRRDTVRATPHRNVSRSFLHPRGCQPTVRSTGWNQLEEPHRMKTSGLPCRATMDCDVVFTPADDKTLKLLLAAPAGRDAHELPVPGYTHRIIDVANPDFAAGPRGRRPRKEAAA